MGEVEQRELRLAERNKVLQMDAIKVSGDVRFDWICPECGNLNDIGLRAFVYAINRHFGIVCSACERSFRPYLDSPDRAAELPLEPTNGQDFSSIASDEIKIQIRLGRNNHLVKEETCPRSAGRINIYLPDNIEEVENSEKS